MTRAYVDLCFAPHWELIDPAREFLQRFFSVTLASAKIAGQVGLAAHELMENAIKYSPNDEASVRVEIRGGGLVTIAVENDAIEANIATLRAEVDAVSSALDPQAFYREKMQFSIERTDGKSCLGLSRIRCEAEMDLRCEVEQSKVRMIASRQLPPEVAARLAAERADASARR